MLILNADDWGETRTATDSALACLDAGKISCVSAMVFMEDSERAAEIARSKGLDAGLHINFSTSFTDDQCPEPLKMQQSRIRRFLKKSKYAPLLYNPALRSSFRMVYEAQKQEFLRLYGHEPTHLDGHQHMHLCTNMLFDPLFPRGAKVRRSFSFLPGEKGYFNRTYRKFVDFRLSKRYRLTDFFFCLRDCLAQERLARAIELSQTANVEVMTHPFRPEERSFLMSDHWDKYLASAKLGRYHDL